MMPTPSRLQPELHPSNTARGLLSDPLHRASLVTLIALLLTPLASRAQDFIPVPPSVVQTIGDVLPERSNAGAAFVSAVYSPNLVVSAQATVQVIFVWEGAGYYNTLGYFTYEEDVDGAITITSSDLLFPNASFPNSGDMQIGDVAVLRDATGAPRLFQPGDRIGFFVVADGWRTEPRIQSWTYSEPGIPTEIAGESWSIGRGCYTTIDELNREHAIGQPDLSRHVAMIRMQGEAGFLNGDEYFLVGFEDLNRAGNSDDDFNDLVFIVQSDPFDAIENTDVLRFAPEDPDGDGLAGLDDHYPDDSERALVTRLPSSGFSVLAIEDRYPEPGDADFNDAVVAYAFELVSDVAGSVKDVQGTFHLVARGAGLNHRFGLHIPGVPEDALGSIRIERFLSDDLETHKLEGTRDVRAFVGRDQRRIPDVFPQTKRALPPGSGSQFTNTDDRDPERLAASTRVHIEFRDAVDPALLGSVPFDPYLAVRIQGEEWDIHLPGKPGFADRPSHLPVESGPGAFLDDNGFPWMLEVPTTWQFPLERIHVENAYQRFRPWYESAGAQDDDWYLSPQAGGAVRISEPLRFHIPTRAWQVSLPAP